MEVVTLVLGLGWAVTYQPYNILPHIVGNVK